MDEVPVTGFGLKVPEVPVGRPDTLRATDPVNPDNRVMVTVYVVLTPRVTVRSEGEADNEKSPAGALFTV